MANKNQEYTEQYADYAMAQMRRYGIPASVTLAQGILESSNGQSRLAVNENNHFGIKATPEWIAEGGRYGLYSDDKPNEKFCSYDSVGDSYEHHSRFLKENSRYARCFSLSPDDYKGWTQGLEKAGYATGGHYATACNVSSNRTGCKSTTGRSCRKWRRRESGSAWKRTRSVRSEIQWTIRFRWSGKSFFSSPRHSVCGKIRQTARNVCTRVSTSGATAIRSWPREKDGKVVAVKDKGHAPGNKSLTVEYTRPDGSKVQCTYMHLGEVSVKAGDTVQAGQKLGRSGNTGTRTTGKHLHFGVRQIYADGTQRDVDPAAYLAEIAQKGHIKQQVLHNGNDLLARYKGTEENATRQSLSPDAWMKKLLSSEDSGVGLSGCSDPVVEMAMTAFTSLMLLATQIDSKNKEEQKAAISEAMDSRRIDLKRCCRA